MSKKVDKKTAEQIVDQIQECCKQLGWCIGMNESSPNVKGLIIGDQDFVVDTVKSLEDSDEYSVYACGQTQDGEMH